MARPRKHAPDGKHYYECQRSCVVNYWAPANEGRGEQHIYEGRDIIKPDVVHPLRLNGYDPQRIGRDGYPLPGDFIATDKPLGSRYLEDRGEGPLFAEVPAPEVDRVVMRSAFYRPRWSEQMFDNPPPKADDKTPHERRIKQARWQAARGSMAVHISQPLDEPVGVTDGEA